MGQRSMTVKAHTTDQLVTTSSLQRGIFETPSSALAANPMVSSKQPQECSNIKDGLM